MNLLRCAYLKNAGCWKESKLERGQGDERPTGGPEVTVAVVVMVMGEGEAWSGESLA